MILKNHLIKLVGGSSALEVLGLFATLAVNVRCVIINVHIIVINIAFHAQYPPVAMVLPPSFCSNVAHHDTPAPYCRLTDDTNPNSLRK